MIFRAVKNESIDLNDRRLLAFLGIDPNEVNIRGLNALKVDVIFACIRILAGAVGKLPLKIYRDNGKIKKDSGHYLNFILRLRPNEYMSAIDFFECLEIQRNLHGNAFAYIEFHKTGKDRGKIKGLYPLDSTKIEIYMDANGLYSSQNKLWYVATLDKEQVKLKSSEILHIKHLAPDGIQGVSPVTMLRISVENAASSAEYINKFYKSGMQTKGIVHYVGDLSPQAEKVFLDNFERMSNGLKNAHKVSLLPLGYQFQPLKLTLADAQFVENNQLTIRQLASAFGIKNHQLNDLDRATHTNITEQNREFYIDTLLEILTKYEQEMDFKLYTEREISEGMYSMFNADAITRADIKARYEAYRTGIQGGMLAPNEAREKEELEPKEGGDDLYANGSFIRLKDVGKEDNA